MIVYIAGPMKGKKNMNRPAFYEAQDALEENGYLVLNPAKLPIGMPQTAYLPICLKMVDQADVVAMMEGWQSSDGAKIERAYAQYQGKRIVELNWLIGKEASEWE